ncbi:MAG TPA: AMP-binding protein [Vicinamibacterales bacterium]|nr:AMP-binding protein [Vicinamibacterales bacterium]
MRRDTLAGFFRDYVDAARARGRTFILHDNGFRTRTWTYGEVADGSRAFAGRLKAAGFARGDKIVLWGENRGEWVAALWGARLAGVVAVPVDYRASADQAHRIRDIVQARVMLVGAEVKPRNAAGFAIWRMDDAQLFEGKGSEGGEESEASKAGSLAEVIFTSGATADPKGVTLTDANILANIHPIEDEIATYRKYLWPLRPIRFLNLLPLSHMFGQSLATFVPPMVTGTVVFSNGYSPQEIVRQIKSRRVSVLVCVPKVLDLLRDHVERKMGTDPIFTNREKMGSVPVFRRLWIHRDVHRMFGWKFVAILVGGAPLAPELEQFWRERGFLVIQGYGLTETAPIVTLNHPFKKGAPGSVGTAISGVDIKIAGDGEILVRGPNVTSGYYPSTSLGAGNAPAETPFDTDGWFHTGDVGELDAEGRLTIKGRKKEMIVTAQGLNVFPDDVERAVNAQRGVRDSAVVGLTAGGEERVHAVLVLESGADAEAIVRGANAALEEPQRVWSWSVWPGDALPRTEGTRKLKRREVQRWAQGGAVAPPSAPPGQSVEDIVTAAIGGRPVTRDTRFDELGLGSLDRMQLLARVEDVFDTSIDEGEFAAAETVGQLANLVERVERGTEPVEPRAVRVPDIPFPDWNQSWPIRAIRRASLQTWVSLASRPWMRMTIEGLENLEGLDHPVIFAPNHQSHMDTPAVLHALPPRWRYRVSPAMAKEWFKAHFFPDDHPLGARVRNTASYLGATIFYNAFPIPQYEAGARQTIRYIGRLFDQKRSLLIFPEGKRTDSGEINVFRPGIGLIGSKLGVPVVPVRIEGLDKVLSLRASWPTRGPVRITFGKPVRLEGDNYVELAAKVRDGVIALQPYSPPEEGSVAQ